VRQNETDIPRTIWFVWFQGLARAPYVVRQCHDSWVARNPSWRVVTLDQEAMPAVTSIDYSGGHLATLSRQHQADLLRLDLLAHHGGVWADATCFCVQPLDTWLIPRIKSGFFAFDRPRPDRIISNWFLAAQPGNVLVSRLFDCMLAYWRDHSFRADERELLVKVLTRLLRGSPRTRGWWFSRVLRDWLAVSPYFAFTYGFERLVGKDPECGAVWRGTPKVSAVGPHHLYRSGLLLPPSAALRSEIDRKEIPVYKTAWNLPGQSVPPDSALGYLFDTIHTDGQVYT
jgi:Capsular polysaccharide synthesis protein